MSYLLGKITLVVALCSTIMASTEAPTDLEQSPITAPMLVLGCRPWDPDLAGVAGLERAEFVDYSVRGPGAPPAELPANFHHLDWNDKGIYSRNSPDNPYYDGPYAGKFSEFAAATANRGKYGMVLIDWVTYQHIRRPGAWQDFAALLQIGGELVVPVTSRTLSKDHKATNLLQEQLTDLEGLLRKSGFDVNTIGCGEIPPGDGRFNLLRRTERNEFFSLPRNGDKVAAAIIIAIKQ